MSARLRLLGVFTASVLLTLGLSVPVPPAGAAGQKAPEYYTTGLSAPNPVGYAIAGGAPMKVYDWGRVNGEPADPATLAPLPAKYTNAPLVADGTFLHTPTNGRVYRVVEGGRAYHLPAGSAFGDYVDVDHQAVAECDHLNCTPWGRLQTATVVEQGKVRLTGWAMDPEVMDPVDVEWIVDGSASSEAVVAPRTIANLPNAEAEQLYGRKGNFGFDVTITVPAGQRQICLWVANLGKPGPGSRMNCATVNVPAPPLPPTAFPSAPRKVKAVAKQGKAVVKWKAPASSGDGPVTEYVVMASTGQKVNTKKTKAVVRRLKPGKKVTFTVTAYNKFGAGAESKRTKKVRIRR